LRKRTFLLTTAFTAGLLTLPITSAAAAPSGLQGDFTGGYMDLGSAIAH
jgi:hypothetical protein